MAELLDISTFLSSQGTFILTAFGLISGLIVTIYTYRVKKKRVLLTATLPSLPDSPTPTIASDSI